MEETNRPQPKKGLLMARTTCKCHSPAFPAWALRCRLRGKPAKAKARARKTGRSARIRGRFRASSGLAAGGSGRPRRVARRGADVEDVGVGIRVGIACSSMGGSGSRLLGSMADLVLIGEVNPLLGFFYQYFFPFCVNIFCSAQANAVVLNIDGCRCDQFLSRAKACPTYIEFLSLAELPSGR